MIVADKWLDYEILDCGNGMKKERWGDMILVRPDPQIIWPLKSKDWGTFDAFYHRSKSGGGKWEFRQQILESWQIAYGESKFKIRPTSFKHTGLFPEQAVNWDWIDSIIRDSKKDFSVLNLFGYTGGATIAAAKAGANVCHVDASKGMVQWCKENAFLSNLEEAPIRYIVDDCVKFVEREIRRGSQYDGVIMDPPSYGRGKRGEVWQFERDLWNLLKLVSRILSGSANFVLVNAYTTGISPTIIGNLLNEALGDKSGSISSGEIGLPISNSGNVLPCGIYARWQA